MSVKPDESKRLQEQIAVMEARHRLYRAIRGFFEQQGFLEIDTPVRVPAPALEENIDCPGCENGDRLRASPELHMKRLLAALTRPIYQMGPCFREGERGRWHLPEFTMLEWYRPGADCQDILGDTMKLVQLCASCLADGRPSNDQGFPDIDWHGEWDVRTVDEVFAEFTDLSLDQAVAADCFESLLVKQILPHACGARPLVLNGFPMSLSGLARCHPETGRAERWELYVGGVELANAYSELTDYQEQIERFQEAAEVRRSKGWPIYPVDGYYLEILRRGFPACGGIAMGIDRLLMVLLGKNSIDQVVPFVPEGESPIWNPRPPRTAG